jgi:hypothetical protein
MPGNISRYMDVLEYPVLKGFSGLERVESIAINPEEVSGFAADSLGNYWINAGTILSKVPGKATHTVLGGWVTGETAGEGVNAQNQGNNGTAPTAQVQKVTITGTPTGGSFTLKDENGNQTAAINYNATAAEVQAALRALPGSAGGYTVTGGPGPGTAWTITSAAGLLGLKRNLTVSTEALTGGTTPKAAVAQETEGQYISGILGINLRFFNLEAAAVQPGPMLVSNCNFDATKIQNYSFYAAALQASTALRNCRFENPS